MFSISQKTVGVIIVTIVGNGHGDLSSNPGLGCLYFT